MLSLQYIVVLLQVYCVFCEDLPKWQEKYHYEATKTHLTSGVIEKINYWRTNDSYRKDTYDGAAKIIFKEREHVDGILYEIHPQTNGSYTNKLFCAMGKNSKYHEEKVKDELLPEIDDTYTHIGYDTLEIGDVKVFKSVDEDYGKTVTTVWAKYENTSWYPARVEIIKFGEFRENLLKHIVIDIINYNTNFSDVVFDTKKYNCTEAHGRKYLVGYNEEINVDVEENLFAWFLTKQKPQYEDLDEKEMRRQIFKENMRRITAHNNRKSTYRLGVNKFIDRTPSEMDKLLSLIPSSTHDHIGTIPFPHELHALEKMKFPKQYDLRLKGWITPVQDQLECKAGWAISAAGAVAAVLAAKTEGPLPRLSSQAIIDCAWGYKGQGCKGGNDTSAYQWIMAKGAPLDIIYGPYANQNGFCATKKLNKGFKIQGFTVIPPRSVEGIKYALINHGPVTTAMHTPYDLIIYTGGIFYSTDCDDLSRRGGLELDHLVTIVGYGRHLGEEYWIIKNSWGKDWGVDGYFFMSMRNNNCGITDRPVYPVA
ncbi:cysteine proteinase 3-like [Aricia agestis]|uniref:cysteine proteinase 3-like n=1 Tax=Aricia agestis TaxID=91739 RepID=UPI001C20C036|nr:cysteine proteinase 3-like [Aricia agestis]